MELKNGDLTTKSEPNPKLILVSKEELTTKIKEDTEEIVENKSQSNIFNVELN